MKALNSTDGFTLHAWMVTKLGLGGYELLAYAVVHQFSQSKAGCYTGGVPYLAAWLKCSTNTARKYLHILEDKGLIQAKDGENDGVPYRYYEVIDNQIPKFFGGTPKNFEGDPKKTCVPTPKNFGVENNIDNTKDNNFNFQDALIAAGVRKDVVEAWLQVRKAKRAVNTELALKSILREIEKTGRTANECIEIAVEQSWRGFKSDWIDKAANATAKQMTHDAFLKSTL